MKLARTIVASAVVLSVLIGSGMLGVRAQQPADKPAPEVTTQWIGHVVAGRDDPVDRITPHSVPIVDRNIEIGLRSDGVVVWRRAVR